MHLQGIREACTPGQEATASRELKPQEWKTEVLGKPLCRTAPSFATLPSLLLPAPPPKKKTKKKHKKYSRRSGALFFYSQEVRREGPAQVRRRSGAALAQPSRVAHCYDLSIGLCVARPIGAAWRPLAVALAERCPQYQPDPKAQTVSK